MAVGAAWFPALLLWEIAARGGRLPPGTPPALGWAFLFQGLVGAAVLVWAVRRWRSAVPVVEVWPDRFVLRDRGENPFDWDTIHRIAVADVARLWSRGEAERRPFQLCIDRNELHVTRRSGGAIRLVPDDLPLDAVQLERLIREATGLTVPGRPPTPPRSAAVRRLRAAVGADPDGPVARPENRA